MVSDVPAGSAVQWHGPATANLWWSMLRLTISDEESSWLDVRMVSYCWYSIAIKCGYSDDINETLAQQKELYPVVIESSSGVDSLQRSPDFLWQSQILTKSSGNRYLFPEDSVASDAPYFLKSGLKITREKSVFWSLMLLLHCQKNGLFPCNF